MKAETKNGGKMMVAPYQQFSRLDPVSSYNHRFEHAMIHRVIVTNGTWVQGKIGCMFLSVPCLNFKGKKAGLLRFENPYENNFHGPMVEYMCLSLNCLVPKNSPNIYIYISKNKLNIWLTT